MAMCYSLPRVKLNNLLGNFDKSFYNSWAEEVDGAVDSHFKCRYKKLPSGYNRVRSRDSVGYRFAHNPRWA